MTIDEDWWRGAVIYHIYPLSFFDSDGDGLGDLPGILSKLDYIAALGVDAIWISPFYTSPLKDFGYDIADHRAVDPRLGTIEVFAELTRRAHALGLKVMTDMVWSHTSDAHPWFGESRLARTGDKADWFVWADPAPDGTPPNNWLAVFGGQAWSWEPRRGQYYLHHFLPDQPQLNLRCEAVIEALLEIASFWLDLGVDGFRFDAVDFFFHDPELRSNPPKPAPPGTIVTKPFGLQHHRYDMLHADIPAFMARIRRHLEGWPGTVALGEVSSQEGALDRIADYTRLTDQRFHMAYTLAVMKKEFSPDLFVRTIEEGRTAMADGWVCWSFSNHDTERAATRWLKGAAKEGPSPDPVFTRLLMTLLLCLKGSICVYQGEELGLPEGDVPHAAMRDPYGLAFWPNAKGRDGARTPIPWRAAAPQAGFTEGGAPWLPVSPNQVPHAVDAQEHDPASPLNAWRHMLRWRKRHRALVDGDIAPVATPAPFLAFTRGEGPERLLAIFNLDEAEGRLELDLLAGLRPLDGMEWGGRLDGGGLHMQRYGALVGRLA